MCMASRNRPQWLGKILNDSHPPPRAYAWTLDNLNLEGQSRPAQFQQTSDQRDLRHRVYVLGLGNLGRLYATCLSQLSNPPPITLIVHRRSLLEHWASQPGIEMTRYGHLERLSNFNIEWWTDEKPTVGPVQEVAQGGQIRNLIVATKAPDAISEVDRLRRYLDCSSTVAFVQNGMNRLWPPHGAHYSAHRYPAGNHPNYLHGVTMHGVFSEGPFKSVHAAPADVVIGPVLSNEKHADAAKYLTKLITTAPHLAGRAVPATELWIIQLEKLVINMIINPLTAILRVRNGELFVDQDGEIVGLMDQLLKETSDVFNALLQHESTREILKDSNIPMGVLIRRLAAPTLRDMLWRIGEKVKFNKSSMFQDVEAGKQTEIREFNGWLVETAELLDQGLDVSTHKLLIELVERGMRLDKAELGCYLSRTRP
ncbi:2-dehydropantoate 2-reductase (Ketopantoate reductase) (KPA reductase) (KPR) [Gnomoniopsis sp. IMI 355080]|nr:2-dehydropantoate 2-reductase (Ketopantoate reductase) (KPA reductase) (KPR) [Gnomoniopsis sp. IMI 355080]